MVSSRKLLTIIYLILVMVLVSLKETYYVTHKIFANEQSIDDYIDNLGFVIHIIMFSLLVALPVFVKL
jgi:hypothetical protein